MCGQPSLCRYFGCQERMVGIVLAMEETFTGSLLGTAKRHTQEYVAKSMWMAYTNGHQ